MKTKPFISPSETFEDLVFESRNKSYGAYDLNKKNRKYLLIAFLISLTGVSSVVAVPFINSIKGNSIHGSETSGITKIELTDVEKFKDVEPPPPPPPPPVINEMEQRSTYVPVVVEEPVDESNLLINEDWRAMVVNAPPPEDIPFVPSGDKDLGIDEIVEVDMVAPQESARFKGGDVGDFRIWVMQNITYPQAAIENRIFGKVIIGFSVNTKGEIVNIVFLRKLDPLVDAETLRVISSSPRWTPAKQGGNPVRQRFVIPITFQLN
jgi:protein TonB